MGLNKTLLAGIISSMGGPPVMPTGALGIWYADQYSATPRPYVPNSLSSAPTGLSLLGPGRRLFGNSTYWNAAGITITDPGLTAPDGTASASLFSATGNWYLTTPSLPVLAAGQYTLCASVKRNGGTDQTFVMKFFTEGLVSSVKTAGASWSRVTFTGTVGAGAQFVMPLAHNAGAAADIQVCDVELFPGAVDLHQANAGHMMLGRNLGDSAMAPTYASGKLDFSSGALGFTQLSSAVSLAQVTAIAVVEKVAAGGTHQAFFSDMRSDSWIQFSALMEMLGNSSFWLGGVDFVPAVGGSGLWNPLNRGVHMITQRYDGTKGDLFLDDSCMFTGVNTVTGPTIADFSNFSLSGITTGYKMVALALYNRALTDTEIRTAYSALKTRAALNSISMTGDTTNRIVAFEGDSITSGDGSITSYAMRYGPNASPAVFGTNFAVGGAYIGTSSNNMQARAAGLDRVIPVNKNGRTFILSVMCGNDLLSRTTTQYTTDLASYLTDRRAAGWDKIVVGTVTPRTVGGFNTARNTVNPILRTWVGSYCDAIADFAADATIGADAHASDVAKYGDGTHPTNATQIVMESIIRPVLNAQ